MNQEHPMFGFLKTTLRPGLYHGFGKKPPFFEGWYYKLVSADQQTRYAIIPGVILSGESHAFVQVLDGVSGASQYHRFPKNDFWASRDRFEIQIGSNRFDVESLSLDLEDDEGLVKGDLTFGTVHPWPVRWHAPGVMGWYAWLPFMQCYHGVLSFDHGIEGSLAFDDETVDFSGGRGYIEKDWGKAFPDAYVWMQTNHFERVGVSLTASIAIIPWLGSAFPGYIVGLWLDGDLYPFATYTGAELIELEIGDQQVLVVLEDRRYRLSLQAQRAAGGLIKGPSELDMGRRIDETLNARVAVTLSTLDGEILFEGIGHHAGLEVFEHAKLLDLVASS
jgi:hypothetical protein